MAESVEGLVKEIIFTNEDNGYTICELQSNDESFVVVGYMPFLNVGDCIKASGSWVSHLEYGQQFKAEYFERRLPEDKESILIYLSSGAIKGIKEATARRIVDRFGDSTLEVIQNFPERLTFVKGISSDKANSIHEQYIKQINVQQLIAFFSEYGINTSYAFKAYLFFGDSALEKIKNNPYNLCDIDGIGFKTADKIAAAMGVDAFDPARIDAAILYCLQNACSEGHTFLPDTILIETASKMLNIPPQQAQYNIHGLINNSKLVCTPFGDIRAVYLPKLYKAERRCAQYLLEKSNEEPPTDFNSFEQNLVKYESENFKFAPLQKKAVYYAAMHKAVVITGGPGTGKTTIINTIIKMMNSSKIVLCAPTGRAAKRMSETCGREAQTIHRALGMQYSAEQGKMAFSKNASNPIDAETVIVDEMSMVDILLFESLLDALPAECRIIMVGDSNQLPSVGAGNVLWDIINSGKVKTVCLKEIFRQAEKSMIVVNAHNINEGMYPVLDNKQSDFFYIQKNNQYDAVNEIIGLCAKRLPKFLNKDFLSTIQVLTPTRMGALGVNNLNNILQSVFNPAAADKKELKFRGFILREGDKIMQVRNNYDIDWEAEDGAFGTGVFNGDIGIIEKIDSGALDIVFDGVRKVSYPKENLEDLELAYAMTVHKSQGSEFPAVVMPMFPAHKNLMSRNLFYTAVTRAKELVVLVGRRDIINYMTDNNYVAKRFCGLCNLLKNGENKNEVF